MYAGRPDNVAAAPPEKAPPPGWEQAFGGAFLGGADGLADADSESFSGDTPDGSGSEGGSESDSDAGSEGGSDSDSDTDSEGGGDADSGSGSDAGSDADADADPDPDADAEGGAFGGAFGGAAGEGAFGGAFLGGSLAEVSMRGRRERRVVTREQAEAALAGLTTTTSECAEEVGLMPGAPCASAPVLTAVRAFAAANAAQGAGDRGGRGAGEAGGAGGAGPPGAPGPGLLPSGATPEGRAVLAAAEATNCASESCVLLSPEFRAFVRDQRLLDPRALEADLLRRFKEKGPRHSLGLLSNFNIDGTMRRWARKFDFFFPCPFAMMDFDSNGDLFGSLDVADVLSGRLEADLGEGRRRGRPHSALGCVLNTDTSRGPGKHWVAVFVDCRAPPWSVEYFNSAGNPPSRAVTGWMERTRVRLGGLWAREAPAGGGAGPPPLSVAVTRVDHQQSQTECGLYALFYIRRRLEGTPYSFFFEQLVPDAAMTKFREHIFRSEK
jgi:hypothetical protein